MTKYCFIIISLAIVSESGCVLLDVIHSSKTENPHQCPAETENCTAAEHHRPSLTQHQSRPWLSDIFHEAEKQFTIHPDSNVRCKHEFNLYKTHLANLSLWAVRMFESSEWPKVGLLRVRKPAFGHFVECTTIDVTGIKGQHCMVDNAVDFDDFSDTRPEFPLQKPREEASVWAAIQLYKNDRARKYRNKFVWALCVPSSCTSTDLNLSLRRTLRAIFEKYALRITTNVRQSWCRTSPIKRSVASYYIEYLIGLLIVTVLLASIYAHKNGDADQRLRRKIISCFSIQRNHNALVKVVPEREYMLIHVAKLICTSAVTATHSVLFRSQEEHYDAEALEEISHNFLNQISTRLTEPVSTLFFIGGVLTYLSFQKSDKMNAVQILTKILKRWLKFFPIMLIVIYLYTYYVPSLNDGPLWYRMVKESSYCRVNLLPTLLTLPSARHKAMCYPPTWTIAVDFQLFVINYTCFALIRRYKQSVTRIFSFLLIVASICAFYMTYRDQHRIVQFVNVRNNDVANSEEENSIFSMHMSTVSRFSCQAVGIIAAAMASKLREQNYTISKAQQIRGWSTIFIMHYALTRCSQYFYELYLSEGSFQGYSRLTQAVYGAFFYYLTFLPVAYFFFIYLVNRFDYLERRVPVVVVYLSRLSFCIYACNYIVIQYRLFSQHTHTFHGDTVSSLAFLAASDLFYVLIFSTILHFLLEAPIQNLIDLLIDDTRSKNPRQ